MNVEAIIGLIVAIVFGAVATLLKMQHDSAVEQIKELRNRMTQHHEETHGELSRTIGRLEAKVERCERNQHDIQ